MKVDKEIALLALSSVLGSLQCVPPPRNAAATAKVLFMRNAQLVRCGHFCTPFLLPQLKTTAERVR